MIIFSLDYRGRQNRILTAIRAFWEFPIGGIKEECRRVNQNKVSDKVLDIR